MRALGDPLPCLYMSRCLHVMAVHACKYVCQCNLGAGLFVENDIAERDAGELCDF
jgi:hypothetical protein